jgi:hypothetical protein
MSVVFGRTNESFPNIWASLSVPDGGFTDSSPSEFVEQVRDRKLPICIASQPALWGGLMRGGSDVLIQSGTLQIESATSEEHATDLVQAHLIETLSSLGRECVDFYFLRVRRALEEFQINGALAAMEFAKQEGHVRFLGLRADGPPLSVLGLWQFHDAFEALWVSAPLAEQDALETLGPLAATRRVGVLKSNTTELAYGLDLLDVDRDRGRQALASAAKSGPTLISVRGTSDLDLLETQNSDGLYNAGDVIADVSFWENLEGHENPRVRRAFQNWREDQ